MRKKLTNQKSRAGNCKFVKMLQIRNIFFLLLLVAAILCACSKGGTVTDDGGGGGIIHGPAPQDTTAPVLSISNPVADQAFTSGTTFNITGTITDDYGLYQGYVKVTNDANGMEIKKQGYEIHGFTSYNFTVPFTPSVTTVSNYTVTVSFEDHGSNSTTKTVKIKINP
jgi:phosphate-selective porin